MPEGDAVRRTAGRLNEALAGLTLTRADLRVPRFATVELLGGQVLTTEVVGKHLLTRVMVRERALTLHTHLRMDGRWTIGPAGARPIGGPGHQIRAWLANERAQAVGLRLGVVEVLPTDAEQRAIGHLGPDILGPGFDADRAAARVLGTGDRPLVETLLDQTVLCGMGTIWAAETAFHARASPWTASARVAAIGTALAATRADMQRALAARTRLQIPPYQVYGRRGQPCRVCGAGIRTGRVGQEPTDRITYWCPGCQPGAGPNRTSATR